MAESGDALAAIVFADIAGSTKLYESLGDTVAQDLIRTCLDAMHRIVVRQGGRVVKSIGDELMCELPTADAATQTAVEIQQHFQSSPPSAQVRVMVRIGLHYGPVIHRENDLFGDAVNVAARMASMAKAGQIITSADTVARMCHANRTMTRHFDVTPVKGKSEAMAIHEVLWEADNVTAMVTSLPGLDTAELSAELQLDLGSRQAILGPSSQPFLLGREQDCDLQVLAPTASRHHARIEYRRGKFVLVDQSTNGTFVCVDHNGHPGEEIFLRREEYPLIRSGTLSLGVRREQAGEHLIRFAIS